MQILSSLSHHYSLFGLRGVWMNALARIRNAPTEMSVDLPGIKHPLYIRLRTSDLSVLQQVLLAVSYTCDFVTPPKNIIDAGANIGISSIFFANKYPEANIIALEPEPNNYKLLLKNVCAYPKIHPVQAALWKDEGPLKVIDRGSGDWGFRVTDEVANGASAQTQGRTVATLMNEYGLSFVDLLKIDIEGSEREVFEDSSLWVNKVGAIAIELHDNIKPGCQRAFADATLDFDRGFRRGETIFMTRSGYLRDTNPTAANGRP